MFYDREHARNPWGARQLCECVGAFVCDSRLIFTSFCRYEEVEVRKKLEERERQEEKKRREEITEKESGGQTSPKASSISKDSKKVKCQIFNAFLTLGYHEWLSKGQTYCREQVWSFDTGLWYNIYHIIFPLKAKALKMNLIESFKMLYMYRFYLNLLDPWSCVLDPWSPKWNSLITPSPSREL